MTERHARALLKIQDERLRKKALDEIIEKGLNVSKSEELVEKLISQEEEKKEKPAEVKNIRVFKDVRIFANTIKKAIDIMKKSKPRYIMFSEVPCMSFWEQNMVVPTISFNWLHR